MHKPTSSHIGLLRFFLEGILFTFSLYFYNKNGFVIQSQNQKQSKRTNLTTDQLKLFSKVSFVHVYAVLVTLLVSVLLRKSHLENYSTLLMGQQSNKKELEGLIGDADKSHSCSEAQRASYGSVI